MPEDSKHVSHYLALCVRNLNLGVHVTETFLGSTELEMDNSLWR